MTKKIYVGNLPYSTVEDEVQDLFAQYGDVVSIAMINDRDTGRFRGFCFVEMEDTAAESAIEALDGQDFNGRGLRVNEARPRENRRDDRRGGRSSGGRSGERRSDNRYGQRNRW